MPRQCSSEASTHDALGPNASHHCVAKNLPVAWRRDAPYSHGVNGGEGLFQQMHRVTKDPPEWKDVPVALRRLYEAVAELKLAFVHHTQAPNAHPRGTKTGP